MSTRWSDTQREDELRQLRADRSTAYSRLKAAREFVIRHPSLTLIDLAEFDAFLKMEGAIDAVSGSGERGK